MRKNSMASLMGLIISITTVGCGGKDPPQKIEPDPAKSGGAAGTATTAAATATAPAPTAPVIPTGPGPDGRPLPLTSIGDARTLFCASVLGQALNSGSGTTHLAGRNGFSGLVRLWKLCDGVLATPVSWKPVSTGGYTDMCIPTNGNGHQIIWDPRRPRPDGSAQRFLTEGEVLNLQRLGITPDPSMYLVVAFDDQSGYCSGRSAPPVVTAPVIVTRTMTRPDPRIGQLEGRVTVLEADNAALKSETADLRGRVRPLEVTVAGHDARMDNWDATMEAHIRRENDTIKGNREMREKAAAAVKAAGRQ